MEDMIFGTGPYAVSQPVTRTEDPRLLRGGGAYTDDKNLAGQAYAVFVRSPIAHGTVGNVEVAAAKAAPGVLSVLTAADIEAAGLGTLPNNLPVKSRDGSPLIKPARPLWQPTAFAMSGSRLLRSSLKLRPRPWMRLNWLCWISSRFRL